jgi:hypothetical protein
MLSTPMAVRNVKGQWFGELRAVRQVGVVHYVWQGTTVPVSAWLMRCKRGHKEVRSLNSLRVSGSNAKCGECKTRKRLKKP